MEPITIVLGLLFSAGVVLGETKGSTKENENLVKATYFYEDGTIAQTGYFINGRPHGKWKLYNTEGKKIGKGKFQEGKKTGKWHYRGNQTLGELGIMDEKTAHLSVVYKEN